MDASIMKYRAFIRTVEYGSFTKAAQYLNYSQSGISRMIGDLEKEWQVSLLERGRFGVRLTSDGMKLLPYAKEVCEAHEKLQMEVDALRGLQSGMIRIGTITSVATHWLPKIIKEFQKDYPGIDYELLMGHYADIAEWILEGRVDCGFLKLPTKPEFETLALKEDPLLVVLPADHELAGCEKFPIEALENDPFMLLEKGTKAEISELFDHYQIKPRIHFTTIDDYAVMSMVESGLGISILPELILQKIPYHIVIKELNVPAYRTIAFALKSEIGRASCRERVYVRV